MNLQPRHMVASSGPLKRGWSGLSYAPCGSLQSKKGGPMTLAEAVGAQLADRAARRTLLASWIGWMFDGYESYAFVLVMPIAVRQLVPADQSDRVPFYAGAGVAAMLLGWATGGIVAGVLADYFGRKRVLMASILWYAAFAGMTAFAPTYWTLLVFRFLTGLGLGAEWGAGTAIVAEFWPAARRGLAAGLLQSGFGAGFFLASAAWLFVGPLGPSSWRWMFLIGVFPASFLFYIRRHVED